MSERHNDHDASLSPEITEGSCMAGEIPEEAVEALERERLEEDAQLQEFYGALEGEPEPDVEEGEEERTDEEDEEVFDAEAMEVSASAARAVLRYPGYFAHRFVGIHRSNWTAGRQGQRPQFVVIHIMEGSYAGSISWAQNPASNVSWHYACARDGHTTQNLGEHNTAWTNSVWWYNIRGVTIEHGGYCRYGGPSDAQLHASAKLTAGICLRNGIPIDRKHIFGHTEIPSVGKPCPCKWPWRRYMNLVRRYAGKDSGGDKPQPAPSQPDERPESKTEYERVNFLSHGAKDAKVSRAAADAMNKIARQREMKEDFAKAITHHEHITYVSGRSAEAEKGQLISVVCGLPARKYLSSKVDVIGTLEKTDTLDGMGDTYAQTIEKVSWRVVNVAEYLGFGAQEQNDVIASYDRDTRNLV